MFEMIRDLGKYGNSTLFTFINIEYGIKAIKFMFLIVKPTNWYF